MQTEDGDIRHPLYHRSFLFVSSCWHKWDERGLLGETGDDTLHEMLFQAQTLSAKLAGALNGLAYDSGRDSGFIVACLKRALQYLEKSLAVSREVGTKKILDVEELGSFRNELFGLREEILKIMKEQREVF